MGAFRLIGRFILFLAAADILIGVWIWLAGHDVTRSLGEIWYTLAPGSLNLSQAVVQRYLHPEIWEVIAVPVLLRPFWEAVVVLFILLLILGSGLLYRARQERTRKKSDRS